MNFKGAICKSLIPGVGGWPDLPTQSARIRQHCTALVLTGTAKQIKLFDCGVKNWERTRWTCMKNQKEICEVLGGEVSRPHLWAGRKMILQTTRSSISELRAASRLSDGLKRLFTLVYTFYCNFYDNLCLNTRLLPNKKALKKNIYLKFAT